MSQALFHKKIQHLIFFFFLASILGYLWEVAIFLIKDDSFCNRGFLYGPWLPIYGIGAVIFLTLLEKYKRKPLRVFFFSLLLGSLLELLAGLFLNYAFALRYWDYRSYPLSIGGYICLYSMLGFGAAGILWVCVLSDLSLLCWEHIPHKVQRFLLTLLILLFLLDGAAALIYPNEGNGVTFPT